MQIEPQLGHRGEVGTEPGGDDDLVDLDRLVPSSVSPVTAMPSGASWKAWTRNGATSCTVPLSTAALDRSPSAPRLAS